MAKVRINYDIHTYLSVFLNYQNLYLYDFLHMSSHVFIIFENQRIILYLRVSSKKMTHMVINPDLFE